MLLQKTYLQSNMCFKCVSNFSIIHFDVIVDFFHFYLKPVYFEQAASAFVSQ